VKVRKARSNGPGWDIIPTPYHLDDPRTSECPRSYITPLSSELLQIATSMVSVQESAVSNLESLDGSLVDALRIVQAQQKAAENAMEEAVANV
jgi:hypothetical protein